MTSPLASIVIPTLQGGDLFRSALQRLRAQEFSGGYEIVVIDSGSEDGTIENAMAVGARVFRISKSNFNHGTTRDRAIAETRGQLIALTVQDAEPADGIWLESLARALLTRDDAAGVYGRQIPRPNLNPILRQRLERWSASRTAPATQRLEPGQTFDKLDPLAKLGLVAFDNVNSCVRRSDWEKCPFGKQRFGEDLRWATHQIVAGRSILFEPKAAVIHSHDSPVQYEFRRIFADHRNLSDLLGLVTVPHLASARRNAHHVLGEYLELIAAEEGLSDARRQELGEWARRYARVENLAQFLGARATHWERSGALKRFFARRLERWLAGV